MQLKHELKFQCTDVVAQIYTFYTWQVKIKINWVCKFLVSASLVEVHKINIINKKISQKMKMQLEARILINLSKPRSTYLHNPVIYSWN